MAKAREFTQGNRPPWMIIFTDMMTLLLTFFIILVSMSVVDEQSRVRVVESVRAVFGLPDKRFNYESPFDNEGVVSGAQSTRPADRRQEARQLVFADNQHLTLRHTEASIVLEASGDMLFEPGGASISEEGRQALDRLVPFLLNLSYPAVISGHSTTGYSEGVRTTLTAERLADNSWALSMDRALAVYRHFIERGVDRYMMKLESFGSHHPAYDNATPEGRLRNRRVDIALDKRNPGLAAIFGRQGVPADGSYIFRDFEFDLNLVSPTEREGRR